MVIFRLLVLFLFLSCFHEGEAQSRVKEDKPVDRILVREGQSLPQSTPALVDGSVSAADAMHAEGEKMDIYLSKPVIASDAQLPSKEFIIERAENIRIEYKPEVSADKNKNPY